MDGEMIRRRAAERAEELPGASLEHPFGPEWDVFKVRGRVFMLQSSITGEPLTTLKARPEDGAALRAAFPEIAPGYHMNKKHWITLRRGEQLDPRLVDDLVTESYLLVLEKNVPKTQWPVDPATFGKRSAAGSSD